MKLVSIRLEGEGSTILLRLLSLHSIQDKKDAGAQRQCWPWR